MLSVSIIIPTLNSERTLNECLESISFQKYKGKKEIIVADGGSSDKTLQIAKSYNVKIIKNKRKTGEAGKAVGAKHATGEILAFIDSDNILPSTNWLDTMLQPFKNPEIVASEPLYFEYRKQDSFLTRYFALLGMGDPLNLFIGNYDRYSYITDKWTNLDLDYKNHGDYLVIDIKKEIPTIGANGFLIKKNVIDAYPFKDYLFDVDVITSLSKIHSIKIAKVKIGIVHLFANNTKGFIRKQRRRVRDYLYYRKIGMREKSSDNKRVIFGIIKFTVSTVLIFPILIQTIKGYIRKRDSAWFFHPAACWITLFTYSYETIKSIFVKSEFSRERWKQ